MFISIQRSISGINISICMIEMGFFELVKTDCFVHETQTPNSSTFLFSMYEYDSVILDWNDTLKSHKIESLISGFCLQVAQLFINRVS